MEPTASSMKIFIGDFEIVDTGKSTITLNLGRHVFATIHIPFEHTHKAGDTLPLFTEISYANPGQTSIQ